MSEPSPPDGDTSRVWFWLIEYMASSPQIDCTTLHNLIEEAPELPNNVRERVALRCLEELFGTSHAVAHEPPSGTEAKVVFELSSTCEDVLELICRETSDLRKGGPELLKWDIHPFIMHKKASMPKCSFDQLKEMTRQGSVPCAALFSQFSGLVHGNDGGSKSTMEEPGQSEGLRTDCQTEVSREESLSQPPANGLAGIGENMCYSNLSSSERGEICGNQGGVSLGRQGNDAAAYCQLADAESIEQGTLYTEMANNNNLVEHSMQGNIQVGEDENSDLGAESQRGVTMEGREESGLLSKDFLAAADQPGSNLCVKCGKNGQLLLCGTDGCTFTIHGSCLGLTPSFDNRGQFCCPFCAHDLAISYYEKMKERMDVTLKQLSSFLRGGSENPSLEHSKRSDGKENGKPGGVASVAEVNRIENLAKEGNQTYSGRDVDEVYDYLFENGAGRLQHFPVAAHGITDKPNSEKVLADATCNSRDSGERQMERTAIVCPLVRVPERRQDQDISDPSRLGDKVSEEQDQAEGETTKKVPDEIGVHKQVMRIPAVPTFENGAGRLKLPPVAAHGTDGEPNSEQGPSDTICNSRGSGERQIERKTFACASVKVPEGKQDQDLPDSMCLDDNLSREKKDITSEEQDQTEGATKKKVPDAINVHQQVIPIPAVPIGRVASDEGHDQTASSTYSLHLRKRERGTSLNEHYCMSSEDAASPRTRRRKVLWTAPEENMLKEAVQKFTKSGITSWKAIIEYGRSVFPAGRTSEDLRSKWKSICKVKAPKSP